MNIARFAFSRVQALYRNRGLIALIVSLGALAILAVVMGRWGAELLVAATGTDLGGLLGEPSTVVTWQQWMSNLNQIVLLVVAVWAGYTTFTLRRDGAATGILTKPRSRADVLHTSWLVPSLLAIGISALVSLAVAITSNVLYSDTSWGALAGSFGLWALNALVWAAFGSLAGVLAPSMIAAVTVPLVAVLLGGILSALPTVADHSFVGLFPQSTNILEATVEPWLAVGTGIAAICIAIYAAGAVFTREDL